MAEAIAEGVNETTGTEAVMRRIPDTLPDEVLEKMGAVDAQQSLAHVPVCTVDELASADAVIFGTPTHFGNMCGQMRQFLDATGRLWAQGALVGKVGSPSVSLATAAGSPSIKSNAAVENGREKEPEPFFGVSRRIDT